jgi:hypothetical protein
MIRLPFLGRSDPSPASLAADRLRLDICDDLAPFFKQMGGFDTPMAKMLIDIFRQAVTRMEARAPEVRPLLSMMRRPVLAPRDLKRLSDIFAALDGEVRRETMVMANELAAQRLAFNQLSQQMATLTEG